MDASPYPCVVHIDLHTHSRVSDGTDAPAELMVNAARAGLDVVALTDHDTTAGWDEAAARVEATGVALVRGTEVSCTASGISVHLLSLLQDPDHAQLRAELERSRVSRDSRARLMVERIGADLGLTWADVEAQSGDDTTIGRPHIADALVARGYVADREEAFETILRTGSPYYVRYHAPDAVEAVRLVRAAGGVPDVAGLELVADPSLAPGDAVGRHPDGYLDARVATALARARAALLRPDDSAPMLPHQREVGA